MKVCQKWFQDLVDSDTVDSEGKESSRKKIAAIQEDINYIESFPDIANGKDELDGDYFPMYR